jgi:hypothetical protein
MIRLHTKSKTFQFIGIFLLGILVAGGIFFYFFFPKLSHTPPSTNENQKTLTISVYFGHKNISLNDCSQTLALKRVIPYTTGVAYSALEQLFLGPTKEEQQAGYFSVWGNDSSILKSIHIDNGTAYVDLHDIRPVLQNISSSCGSSAAFAQLNATLTQFSTIHSVRIAIDGSPKTFYEWVQIGCAPQNDYCNPAPFLFSNKNSDVWATHTDSQKLFSVSYPKLFSKKETTITLYPLKALYPATELSYDIPVEYCALSGVCVPRTKNISIQIASLPLSYEETRAVLTKDLLSEHIEIAGKDGFSVSMGAEGEGLYYYAIPLTKTQTLLITRAYIDESIIISYKTAPEFIPFKDQKKVFDEILKTLQVY